MPQWARNLSLHGELTSKAVFFLLLLLPHGSKKPLSIEKKACFPITPEKV